MDELLQFGCLGFKGVIDITSAYVKPSTTSIPPWAPQDSGIDGTFIILILVLPVYRHITRVGIQPTTLAILIN